MTVIIKGRPLTRAVQLPEGQRKYIAITGTTPSRMECPFKDPLWNPPNGEIWTIGPGGHNITPWHALFEIHGPTTWPPEFSAYIEVLRKTESPKRVFTIEPVPEFPANVVLDREAMCRKYGRRWISSSIAYCIVQAWEEGATDIGLWGIDLESGEEYIAQATGAKHFIDLFSALGVTFHMPAGCGLLDDPTCYPDRWEKQTAIRIEKKREYIQGQIVQKTQEHGCLTSTNAHKEGYIAAIEGNMTADDLPRIREDLARDRHRLAEVTAELHGLNGALGALSWARSTSLIGNPDTEHDG